MLSALTQSTDLYIKYCCRKCFSCKKVEPKLYQGCHAASTAANHIYRRGYAAPALDIWCTTRLQMLESIIKCCIPLLILTQRVATRVAKRSHLCRPFSQPCRAALHSRFSVTQPVLQSNHMFSAHSHNSPRGVLIFCLQCFMPQLQSSLPVSIYTTEIPIEVPNTFFAFTSPASIAFWYSHMAFLTSRSTPMPLLLQSFNILLAFPSLDSIVSW